MTRKSTERRLPPVWLLGLTTLSNGAYSGVFLVTIPQLLAAKGVPEPEIAQVTSIALIPGMIAFLFAPALDIRFTRRTYAVALALIQAAAIGLSLNLLGNLSALTICLLIDNLAFYLFTPAVAGWFGGLVDDREEARLGAWLAVGSVAGFGLMSAAAILLLRGLPYQTGVGAIMLIGLVPLLVFPFAPAPRPEPRLAHEGFVKLAGELSRVVRNRHVLRLMALFAVPAATFALTNTLGGLGRDFHASEGFVGLIGGLGVTAGGVFGALVAPALAKRFPPLALYIAVGLAGALFTLCLLIPARTPLLFAAAMIGENVFQSAAFAVVNALALLSIGKDNPFAATQFAFINAAVVAPITYMQFIDGKAYGWGGLAGSFVADAGFSLAACLLMAAVFATRWRDSVTPEPA
jgi:PAT family beta-lactamase induction signal transducer AmpG